MIHHAASMARSDTNALVMRQLIRQTVAAQAASYSFSTTTSCRMQTNGHTRSAASQKGTVSV